MKCPLLIKSLFLITFLCFSDISWGSVIEKGSLRPPLSFSSTGEVPHRVANGIIENLIKQERLIEVSFGDDNEPIAIIIGTNEKFTLPEDLRNKLKNAKTQLDDYYDDFKKGILSSSLKGRYKKFCDSLLRSYANLNEQSRLQKYLEEGKYINKEFLELLDKARQTKINIVLGSAYISATEKIIGHARRGVTSKNLGYACTIGEWLLEYLKTTEEVTNFILNEALHFENTKPHGSIILPLDYDNVVEHGITNNPIVSYRYDLERMALEATAGHGPWRESLYGGKIGFFRKQCGRIYIRHWNIRGNKKHRLPRKNLI